MSLEPHRTVNVAVQVLPLTDDPYPPIEKAIDVIRDSGIEYEVDAMETVTPRPTASSFKKGRGVMEGPLDRLLEIARAAHLACMEGGAEQAVTGTPRHSTDSFAEGRGVIKTGDRRLGTTIAAKVDRYRGQA